MKAKLKIFIPVIALVGTLLLFRFVLFVGYVPTESMEPTLKKGSVVIASRLFSEPEVGDIVVFQHEGELLIKRVAAKVGDWIYHQKQWRCVPTNSYYLLGDNSPNSWDSRYWDNPYIEMKSIIAILK